MGLMINRTIIKIPKEVWEIVFYLLYDLKLTF